MKRMISLLLTVVLALSFCPVQAENADSGKQGFFTGLGIWLDQMVEEAGDAADSAAEWTQNQWQTIKDNAAELANEAAATAEEAMSWAKDKLSALVSEGVAAGTRLGGTIGSWITDTWADITAGSRGMFQGLREGWQDIKTNASETLVVIALVKQLAVRESLLEACAVIEDTAAEKEVALPEDVQTALTSMKEAAVHQDDGTTVTYEDQAILDFLPVIGLDQQSFENLLAEKLEIRAMLLAIQAEDACLKEYMAENGLSFNSAALRAQDRLNRYAAGELSLSKDEISQASDIVTAWCKSNAIDESAMAIRILERMWIMGQIE